MIKINLSEPRVRWINILRIGFAAPSAAEVLEALEALEALALSIDFSSEIENKFKKSPLH